MIGAQLFAQPLEQLVAMFQRLRRLTCIAENTQQLGVAAQAFVVIRAQRLVEADSARAHELLGLGQSVLPVQHSRQYGNGMHGDWVVRPVEFLHLLDAAPKAFLMLSRSPD